jgi:hypothetical protein
MTHHPECEDATGAYSGSCTCAIIKRREEAGDHETFTRSSDT